MWRPEPGLSPFTTRLHAVGGMTFEGGLREGVRAMLRCHRAARVAAKRASMGRFGHARASRSATEADREPVEDRPRRDDRRHARFLRLLPDRICACIHCRRLAADLRAVGHDPARLRHQRTLRFAVLRLAGGQDRPPQGHDRHRAQLFARHRRDGADAARGMDLPRHLPPARRPRRHRALLGRYHAGAGIRAGRQARLDHRTDHDDVAGRGAAWRISGRLCHALYRLARDVRRRIAARGADALHPRLGSGIALLADADGAD